MFDIVKFIEMHEDASDFFKICIHVQLVVYATYKKNVPPASRFYCDWSGFFIACAEILVLYLFYIV
jgi:hypothetical protein